MLPKVPAMKRAASVDLFGDAKRAPTMTGHSMSQQSVGSRMSDLEKSDDSAHSKNPSLDQLFSVAKDIIGPKKEDSQLKEHIAPDQLSAGSSAPLSFVASHVNVNFTDSSNIIPAHSRPDSKIEQGKFQFTITNISNLSYKYSPDHTIGNLPWKVLVASKQEKDEKFFRVYPYCNSDSSSIFWSCDADIKCQLLSNDSKRGQLSSQKFNYAVRNGFALFLEWSKLMDPDNGYVNNDEVTVEVQVTIKNIVGFREFSEFDFVSDAPRSNSDVVLIVGGQPITVCKHYLSIHSGVFHTMFFSDFIERDKKKIVLEDIEPNEFLELLHVIYPTNKPVTKDNVEFLLVLGDRFEVRFVLNECERFLLSTTEVSIPKKLLYAEKYRIAQLQDVCLKTIKGLADVEALKKQEEYKEYSHETKSAILERLILK